MYVSEPDVTIGSDMEFFFTDGENILPADNFLPNEKAAKSVVDPRPTRRGEALFYDGVQGEFNTYWSTCRAYVQDSIWRMLRAAQEVADASNVKLLIEPATPISDRTMEWIRDPMSYRFGCSPHKSVRLDGNDEIIELDGRSHLVRYAGIHLHFGLTNPDSRTDYWSASEHLISSAVGKLRAVQAIDRLVSLPLVLLETDSDRLRRELYGKAGTFRDKDNGFEYRAFSNLYLRSPVLTSMIMYWSRNAILAEALGWTKEFEVPWGDAAEIIDTVNHQEAYRIWKEMLPQWAELNGMTREDLAAFEFMMIVGVEEVFPDLAKEWRMGGSGGSHGSVAVGWEDYGRARVAQHPDFKTFLEMYDPQQRYL